ncbi:MAG: hypothetical protein IKJ69_06625 [Clostridia bacterium]|nr:hypothetical protein [Clostridia bacterium]
MLKKIIAIAVAVLIIGVIVNNVIKASQLPKFPEASWVENPNSEYVDIVIGDKRYELIESEIADREIELTDKIAMYKDDVSVLFKYASFYSVNNATDCDMIVDDVQYALFCNIEDKEKARAYYGDLNNYIFYGMKSDDSKGFLDKKDLKKAETLDTLNKEFFNDIEKTKRAADDDFDRMSIGINDEDVKEWYTVSALSSDGLVQKNYEFVRTDNGWYYFYSIWVTDNRDIDYCVISLEDILR